MHIARIGVIDDHPFMSAVVSALFPPGSPAEVVWSGATVDELLGAETGFDIAVLELTLRDASSPTQNIPRLRAVGASVVIFTSTDSAVLLQAAARAGADAIVRKSDDPLYLRSAVLALVDEGISPAESTAASAESRGEGEGDRVIKDAGLTPRERDILRLYADGLTNRAVAHETGLSIHTVEKYVGNIRRKYESAGRGARSRVDLYRRAVEDGVLPVPSVTASPMAARE